MPQPTTPGRPLDHYCGTCRYALERHTPDDGPETFVHPAAVLDHIEPHDPAPIPMIEMARLNMLCDFCSTPRPSWLLRFKPITLKTSIPGLDRTDDLGEWWAACGNCRIDVKARSVMRLISRYLTRHPDAEPELLAETVGRMWLALINTGVLQEVRRA